MAVTEPSSIPVGHGGLQKSPLPCGGNGRRLAQELQWGWLDLGSQMGLEWESISCQGIHSASHSKWGLGGQEEMEPYTWATAALPESLRAVLGIPSLSSSLDPLLLGSHICLFFGWLPHFSKTFPSVASQGSKNGRQIWEKLAFLNVSRAFAGWLFGWAYRPRCNHFSSEFGRCCYFTSNFYCCCWEAHT